MKLLKTVGSLSQLGVVKTCVEMISVVTEDVVAEGVVTVGVVIEGVETVGVYAVVEGVGVVHNLIQCEVNVLSVMPLNVLTGKQTCQGSGQCFYALLLNHL